MPFMFRAISSYIAGILLFPHNGLTTLCAYSISSALNILKRNWSNPYLWRFLGNFQAQHYPPKWQRHRLSQEPYYS